MTPHEEKMARQAEAQKEAREFFRNVNLETEERQRERLLLDPHYRAGVDALASLLEELKKYRAQYPELHQRELRQLSLDQWNLDQWNKRLSEGLDEFKR